MVKKLIPPIVSIICIFTFIHYSCGKPSCGSTCNNVFPEITFKIVNTSGQNLVCGPNKIFNTNRVQIKAVIMGILTDMEKTFTGDTTLATSQVLFITGSVSNQYYLYLNNIKTDSFQVTYLSNYGKSDCCPDYYTISQIKLNNSVVTVPFNVAK